MKNNNSNVLLKTFIENTYQNTLKMFLEFLFKNNISFSLTSDGEYTKLFFKNQSFYFPIKNFC